MESDKIMVSICCFAYNHEPYIRKCLDGFIMQKTNFEFEVLIHDDASTDNTTNIIKEYEEKYPDIIKPIYQTENQYSKGVSISRKFLNPLVKGKYIALCEGDDYWTDELKLQKQVDFLENNPEYTICVHQTTVHNCNTNNDSLFTNQMEDKDYTLEEVAVGTGSVFATSSFLTVKSVRTDMPSCFFSKCFGDYQTILYGTLMGKCHYFAANMSVYNYQTKGSWSSTIEQNRFFYISQVYELVQLLKRVNEFYDLKYDDIFSKAILQAEYTMYIYKGDLKKIHSAIYRENYLQEIALGSNPNLRCLKYKFPKLYKIYSKVLKKG